MENFLFTPPMIALLSAPERWRFVGAGPPEDVRPVRAPDHAAWARRHAHAHASREMLFVLSGAGCQSHGGRTYPARPGVVFLFDAMSPHDLQYPPGHGRAEHLWLSFVQDRCAASLVRVVGGRRLLRREWRRWYALPELGIVSSDVLFPGGAPVSPPHIVRRRCAAAAALLMAGLVEKGYQPASARPSEGRHPDAIRAIAQHIKESRGRGCSLESLARIAGYSKYHFLRLFRDYAGMSLRTCVDRARLDALQEMSAAGAPQKVIAAELGFAHPSSLCRWRRRQGL